MFVFVVGLFAPVALELFMPGDPAIAFAKEANKEWREVAAAIDLFEADLDGSAVLGFFFSDTPAQVDLSEADLPCLTCSSYLWKDLLDEMRPLRVHITERGG